MPKFKVSVEHRIIVRRTKDRGRGVFAKTRFRKNQAIGEMAGRVTDLDHCDPSYCVDLGNLGVLDPSQPFRFLNHSCDPNCELVEYEAEKRNGTPKIIIHALRTVREGEELTIDYSWPADSAVRCLCGSEKCRGWVVDPRELHRLRGGRRRSSVVS